MAANGISTLATKQARQAAKLAAAATKRAATGRPSTLDITTLPTQFSGNAIVDNPNADGLILGRPWTSAPPYYVGTIDSSVGNPFTFKVLKSANTGMAAAIANSGWVLTWTDPRFDNGGFTAQQINVRTQTGSGFTSIASQDATYYNFAGWFGAAQLPQGTQFTINWS
jgi:hypothetical protein